MGSDEQDLRQPSPLIEVESRAIGGCDVPRTYADGLRDGEEKGRREAAKGLREALEGVKAMCDSHSGAQKYDICQLADDAIIAFDAQFPPAAKEPRT